MKMVYTNENQLLVANARNILEAHGIEVELKNEFAQGASGGLAVFDAWAELWVRNSSDYARALEIVEASYDRKDGVEWLCERCSEPNDASFEVCWNCQLERGCE